MVDWELGSKQLREDLVVQNSQTVEMNLRTSFRTLF
jgi:hypothetical protein